MKRTYRFIEPSGTVSCTVETGERFDVPVFAGILKHPTPSQLAELLTDPVVARKYTIEALRKAPWNALVQFPRDWLMACLREANVPEARRKALELLLGE